MVDLANRSGHEADMARKLGKAMAAARRQLLVAVEDGVITDAEWTAIADAFQTVIQPGLESVMMEAGMAAAEALGIGIDPAALHARAIDWAREASYSLVRQLDVRNRALLQETIGDYFANRLTLADVETRLMQAFGPVRASMIAVSEVTRASAQGEIAFANELRAMGLQPVLVIHTSQDERVCPICGPLHNKTVDEVGITPPFHPRCRCNVATEIVGATR